MPVSGRAAEQREPRSFLREERRPGYPPEYLRSRIRGRRSKLIRNWRAVLQEQSPALHLASPHYAGFVRERTLERMWAALQGEHAWIFTQMDEGLRRAVAPYFLYVELRTVIMCLRYRAAERAQQAGELLQESLLCRDVQDLLRSAALPALYGRLEDRFCSLSSAFRGLAAWYEDGDVRSAERHLTDAYLRSVLTLPLHPVLRGLFIRLIDARNLLALYTAQRFGARDRSVFVAGGTIAVDRLAAALGRDDPFAVLPLLRQATAIALAEPELTRLETALYRSVMKYLRTEGRDPMGTALVLDYLWRCSLEITNLSLLFAGKDLGREELAAELVH